MAAAWTAALASATLSPPFWEAAKRHPRQRKRDQAGAEREQAHDRRQPDRDQRVDHRQRRCRRKRQQLIRRDADALELGGEHVREVRSAACGDERPRGAGDSAVQPVALASHELVLERVGHAGLPPRDARLQRRGGRDEDEQRGELRAVPVALQPREDGRGEPAGRRVAAVDAERVEQREEQQQAQPLGRAGQHDQRAGEPHPPAHDTRERREKLDDDAERAG